MNCLEAEEYLSGYMESSLPAEETRRIAAHLKECPDCSTLLDEMLRTVSLCRSCPDPEMDADLLQRILDRTSARERELPLMQRLRQFAAQPLLLQRFAFGSGLAVMFIVLLASLMLPRIPADLSSISPSGVYEFMDRSVRHLYGEGLKAYDKQNEWQAQITYLKNRMIHRLQFMMERYDVPDEGGKDPAAPERDEKNAPREQSGSLRMWAG